MEEDFGRSRGDVLSDVSEGQLAEVGEMEPDPQRIATHHHLKTGTCRERGREGGREGGDVL